MKFGDNLKLIRKSKKISQEVLADKLGVSRQSVSKWETGENYPSMQNIICLCTIFKCKINELVHEDFVDINFLDEEIKMNVVKFKEEEQKKMKGISKILYLFGKVAKIGSTLLIALIIILTMISTYILINTNIDIKNNNGVICGEKIDYELSDNYLNIISKKDNKEYKIEFTQQNDKTSVENFLNMTKGFKITLTLLIEFSLLIAMVALNRLFFYLEKIFKNIHDNETPFDMDNVRYIKYIAVFVFIYIFIQDLVASFAGVTYNMNFNIDIELSNYFLVLIIFAVSYIFKYGYEIQLDSKGKMYGEINE